MRYREQNGLRLSTFSLGTVQLGMPYGINNHSGKPSEQAAFAMLDRAVALGVNSLDTANDYGDAEQLIGRWLRTRSFEKPLTVTTKIGNLDHSSLAALRRSVREQVDGCKKRLGLKTLPMLMLHRFEDYDCDRKNMRRVLDELKQGGEIDRSAISAYSRHDYRVIAASGFDAAQIPLNLFDWTRIDDGGLAALRDAGMLVFVRSAFLQGLVFKKPEDLEPKMEFCRPVLTQLQRLCREFSMPPAVLAVSFLLSLDAVSCLVLGCETIAQVVDNAALMDRAVPLTPAQLTEIHRCFCQVHPDVLNPGVWYNAAH